MSGVFPYAIMLTPPFVRPDTLGRTVVVGALVVVVVVGISVSNSSPLYMAQQWRKARMHSQDSVM